MLLLPVSGGSEPEAVPADTAGWPRHRAGDGQSARLATPLACVGSAPHDLRSSGGDAPSWPTRTPPLPAASSRAHMTPPWDERACPKKRVPG
jgi:hypothetical protein